MNSERRRDAGMTLPELLISIVVVGVLIAAASAAVTTTLRTAPRTEARVEASRDMAVLQSWLPLDLGAATETASTPTFDPSTSTDLPGTNVLSIRRAKVEEWDIVETWVSYRYVRSGDDWQLVRYEVSSPGTPAESIQRTVMAHRLVGPPAAWTPALPATHAVTVTNDGSGERFTLNFAGGQVYAAGGSELAEEAVMTGSPSLGNVDTTPPPTRCGGNVTLVLDTSFSVPAQMGGEQLKAAAAQFVDLYTGTPVQMSVVAFDAIAYRMYPPTDGSFVSMLTAGPETAAMRNRITVIDNNDGMSWTQDTNSDGIFWSQTYWVHNGYTQWGGTNWEDGLRMPFFDDSMNALATTPDLVVFVTDGQPNTVRYSTYDQGIDALVAAQMMANRGRETGADIVGVIVGNAANDTWSVDNLKAIVGPVEFDPTANGGRGNATTADLYRASMSNVAEALRTIMQAQCGGTVTLQVKIDDGSGTLKNAPRTSVWTFTTELGTQRIDRRKDSSVTLGYTFSAAQTSKSVRIVQTSGPAQYVFDRVECQRAGVSVPSRVTQPIAEAGQTLSGADILLRSDEALSCVAISRPK